MEYNKDLKQFKFGKISEELKEMFLSFGIKKRDLERDADFAFTLFKKVIVGLGNENRLKNSALDSIEHNFPPPEEREKIRKQEEAAEAKMNSAKTKRTQQRRKETSGFKKTQTKSQNSKPASKPGPKPTPTPTPKATVSNGQKGIPPPPPPPPPPPSVPGAVPKPVPQAASTNNNSKPSPPQKEISMEEEMGKIKLKKVEKTTDKMIQGSGKNFLQNALSTAIRIRRNNLHMHDEDNEDNDEEEDDWE